MVSKMQRTRTIKIDNLADWFPANDRFASQMARICILREELMFELHCYIESRNVKDTTEYKESWRQVYYFRKMHVTIVEMRNALLSLAKGREFKSFLSKQPNRFQEQFSELKEQLELTAKEMKHFRNDLGAHIKEDAVHHALQDMGGKREGYLQISEHMARTTHYEFTGELIMALMLRDSPNQDQSEKANTIMKRFIATTHLLFQRIDFLFFRYLIDRNLLKPIGS